MDFRNIPRVCERDRKRIFRLLTDILTYVRISVIPVLVESDRVPNKKIFNTLTGG